MIGPIREALRRAPSVDTDRRRGAKGPLTSPGCSDPQRSSPKRAAPPWVDVRSTFSDTVGHAALAPDHSRRPGTSIFTFH